MHSVMAGAELGKQRAVPKGPLLSLAYLHRNEVMNTAGICLHVSRNVEHCSSLLEQYQSSGQRWWDTWTSRQAIKLMVLM